MTDIIWSIDHIEVTPHQDGMQDIISVVHWRASAGACSHYGTVSLPAPDGDDFTPFSDLNVDDVLGWVHGQLDKEFVEDALLRQHDLAASPALEFRRLSA